MYYEGYSWERHVSKELKFSKKLNVSDINILQL